MNNSLSAYKTQAEWDEAQKEIFDFGDKKEHFLGSHWDAFGGIESYLRQLPDMLQNSVVAQSFSDMTSIQPPFKTSLISQAGVCLSHPRHKGDVLIVIALEKEANKFASMYPYKLFGGLSFESGINTVYVWDSGLEAQIDIDIGSISLCFFDTHFPLNKDFYIKGGKYRFNILGIAYKASYPKENEITVKMKKEVLRAIGEDVEEDTEKTISLVGMKKFIPIMEWDRDDFSFRGVIKLFKTIEIFEQEAYYVEIDAIRSADDESADIPMIITKLAWQEQEKPKVGDEIDGALWLQGSLVDIL